MEKKVIIGQNSNFVSDTKLDFFTECKIFKDTISSLDRKKQELSTQLRNLEKQIAGVKGEFAKISKEGFKKYVAALHPVDKTTQESRDTQSRRQQKKKKEIKVADKEAPRTNQDLLWKAYVMNQQLSILSGYPEIDQLVDKDEIESKIEFLKKEESWVSKGAEELIQGVSQYFHSSKELFETEFHARKFGIDLEKIYHQALQSSFIYSTNEYFARKNRIKMLNQLNQYGQAFMKHMKNEFGLLVQRKNKFLQLRIVQQAKKCFEKQEAIENSISRLKEEIHGREQEIKQMQEKNKDLKRYSQILSKKNRALLLEKPEQLNEICQKLYKDDAKAVFGKVHGLKIQSSDESCKTAFARVVQSLENVYLNFILLNVNGAKNVIDSSKRINNLKQKMTQFDKEFKELEEISKNFTANSQVHLKELKSELLNSKQELNELENTLANEESEEVKSIKKAKIPIESYIRDCMQKVADRTFVPKGLAFYYYLVNDQINKETIPNRLDAAVKAHKVEIAEVEEQIAKLKIERQRLSEKRFGTSGNMPWEQKQLNAKPSEQRSSLDTGEIRQKIGDQLYGPNSSHYETDTVYLSELFKKRQGQLTHIKQFVEENRAEAEKVAMYLKQPDLTDKELAKHYLAAQANGERYFHAADERYFYTATIEKKVLDAAVHAKVEFGVPIYELRVDHAGTILAKSEKGSEAYSLHFDKAGAILFNEHKHKSCTFSHFDDDNSEKLIFPINAKKVSI